jgi:hypothetical protein
VALSTALLLVPAVALGWLGGGGDEQFAAYQRGVGLIERGALREAADAFSLASRSDDPEVRWRAFHNLAVARLRLADTADSRARTAEARAAASAAMEALRLWPYSAAARRNLALALTLLGESGRPSSATGADTGVVSATGATGPGGQTGRETAALTPEEAVRILDALRSVEGGSAVAGILAGASGSSRETSGRRGPPW